MLPCPGLYSFFLTHLHSYSLFQGTSSSLCQVRTLWLGFQRLRYLLSFYQYNSTLFPITLTVATSTTVTPIPYPSWITPRTFSSLHLSSYCFHFKNFFCDLSRYLNHPVLC
jgi:hypothetical protein